MQTVTLTLALALLLPMAQASAQASGEGVSREDLLRLRLDRHAERRTAGWLLMGWGVANAVGGGLVAAVEHDDEAWLAAGVVTAAFGVVNALLAPSLMDLAGDKQRSIRSEYADRRSNLDSIRAREATSQLKTAQTFAFNAGLDVFYIAEGLLLYALGQVQNPTVEWEKGAGLALAIQGAPLLAFDLYNWIAANEHASTLQRALNPESGPSR